MFIFAYLKEIFIGIVGFFALYLFNRNKTLKVEKQQLQQDIVNRDRFIDVQNKIMEATNNIEHSAIELSLERLRKPDKK